MTIVQGLHAFTQATMWARNGRDVEMNNSRQLGKSPIRDGIGQSLRNGNLVKYRSRSNHDDSGDEEVLGRV